MQVLIFGGWPVDRADAFLASFDATDSNCCEDWGGFVGDRTVNWIVPAVACGRVGGAVTVARPGWIIGDGLGRAPPSSLLDSERHCAGCLPSAVKHAHIAYTQTAHTAFPLNPIGSEPRQARSGAVDTPSFEVGAEFRAGLEEKACQGDQAKTAGTLVYSRTSVYESSTREYESLREFTRKKSANNHSDNYLK